MIPSLEQEANEVLRAVLALISGTHAEAYGQAVRHLVAFAIRQREEGVRSTRRKQELLEDVVREATARRCVEIVRQHQHPQPIHQHGDCSTTIATAIRAKFGLTEAP